MPSPVLQGLDDPVQSSRPIIDVEKGDAFRLPDASLIPPELPTAEEGRQALAAQVKSRLSTGPGTGTLPKIIATIAAFSGNFGPLIQLQEQERRTHLSQVLDAPLTQIESLVKRGKLEEANEILAQTFASVGPRNPEAAQYLNAERQRIAKLEENFMNAKGVHAFYTGAITDPNDPRQPALKSLGQIIKDKTPINEKILGAIIQQLQLKSQPVKGTNLLTSELTGQSKQVPLTEVTEDAEIRGQVGDTIAQELGLNVDQIINIMRGLPVLDKAGVNINTPAFQDAIRKRVAEVQGERLTKSFSDALGYEPQFTTMMRLAGINPRDVILGTVSQEKLAEAYRNTVFRARDVGQNNLVFDVELGQQRSDVLPSEAAKNPNRYAYFNVGQAELFAGATKIVGLHDTLSLLADALNDPSIPSDTNILGRTASYIDRRINRILNTKPDTTYQQAVQALVKQEIEEVFNKQKLSVSRLNELTKPLTTDNVSKGAAQAVINGIVDELNAQYEKVLRQGGYIGELKPLVRPTLNNVLQGTPAKNLSSPSTNRGQSVTKPGLKKGTGR